MNPKYTKYILIAAIIGIWSAIIYQFVGSGGEEVLPEIPYTATLTGFDLQKEVSELNLDYRDPFLGDNYVKPSNSNGTSATQVVSNNTKQPEPTPEPEVTKEWPAIQYMGMVKNLQADQGLVMLSVGGKSHVIGKGDAIDDVTLVDYWRDSALVAMAGDTKMIVK